MVEIIFLPSASMELVEAQHWYDQQVPQLGDRFYDAVADIVAHIVRNPRQFPIVRANLRRALLRTFPYGLIFRIESDAVYLVACAQTSRDPQRMSGSTGTGGP